MKYIVYFYLSRRFSTSNFKLSYFKSHNGDADGYADLPPQQRCRQIENKLNGLAKEAATKEQSRAGLEKMLGVYRDNPKMGNAADVERQILQVSKELEGLAEKIERYKVGF